MTGWPTATHQPNLDLFRSAALLLVLAEPLLRLALARPDAGEGIVPVALGRLGILCFFVHLGWTSVAAMQASGRAGGALLRWSWVRRAFRLFPVAMIVMLAVLALRIPPSPAATFAAPSMMQLASNLTLTMNLTYAAPLLDPLWAIPVAWQVGLALPLLFLFLARAPERHPGRVALCVAAAIGAGWALPLLSQRLEVARFVPCILAGLVGFVVAQRAGPRLPAGAGAPLFAALVLGYVLVERATPTTHHPVQQWGASLLLGVLLASVAEARGTLAGTARHVARYAYAAYAWHPAALWLAFSRLDLPGPLRWAVAFASLAVLAIATHHLVEAPMLRVGARLAGAPVPRG